MSSRTLNLTACAAALAVSILCPRLASGAVVLLVDDYADDPINLHLSGADPASVNIQITQEGIGVLGAADAHFEFFSTDPNRPGNGITLTYNYNIVTPGDVSPSNPTGLSDTWSIVLTGHTPTPGDLSNVSVDAHFRSDSLDGVIPPALLNATTIQEDLSLPPPSGLPDNTYQYVGPLLNDMTTGFNSAVPEPSSMVMFGMGIAGLFYGRRRTNLRKS